MTELAAPQISSLMEALPGIAAVLRSPVANAMVAVSRSAAGLEEFQLAHGEELLRFGVRRNLLTQEEVDKVLAELREVMSGRPVKPVPPPDKTKKPVVPPVKAVEGEKAPLPRPKPAPLVVKGSNKPPIPVPIKHPVKPPPKAKVPAKKAAPVRKAKTAKHPPARRPTAHKAARKPAGKRH